MTIREVIEVVMGERLRLAARRHRARASARCHAKGGHTARTAGLAAYGLPADADEERILWHLLALNLERAEAEQAVSG